MKSFVIEENA